MKTATELRTGFRHGCCTDQVCTPATCMELPAGKVCADCRHFPRCQWLLSISGRETSCDWFPRKFSPRGVTPVTTPGSVTEVRQA
jgi:hypothetical protein